MWYDKIFGGSKSASSFYAMIGGTWAYHVLTPIRKGEHFWEYLLFLCACAGVYAFFRVKEKNGKK